MVCMYVKNTDGLYCTNETEKHEAQKGNKKALLVATVGRFFGFERNDIKILQSMGYEVHCAANFSMTARDDYREYGIIQHQIEFARRPFKTSNLTAYHQLKELLRNITFDLVHCHTPVSSAICRLATKKHRKTGLKVIYTAHGFPFSKDAPFKSWLLYYPVEWICAFWTDEIITINKEDYAMAQKHMHAKHVTYIPGVGVDTKKFSSRQFTEDEIERIRSKLGATPDKFILLSVGELQPRKNQIVVINALTELKNPNIMYILAGDGGLYDYYKEVIDGNGLTDNIKLLGYRTDIAELCAAADCFVHPAVGEGLGLAPIEAMACGLPLIASHIGGINDYAVDGVTGFCVDPHSVIEMKDAILKMYNDKDFREKCGLNNIQAAKPFDIENADKIMRNLYSHIDL